MNPKEQARCEKCGEELIPAPARFDGEATSVGYLPHTCTGMHLGLKKIMECFNNDSDATDEYLKSQGYDPNELSKIGKNVANAETNKNLAAKKQSYMHSPQPDKEGEQPVVEKRILKFFTKVQAKEFIIGFSDFYQNYNQIDPPKSFDTLIDEYLNMSLLPSGGEDKQDEKRYSEALKWYKQGALDVSEPGSLFEDGIEADFYSNYASQFNLEK